MLVSTYGINCGIATYTSYLQGANSNLLVLSESPKGKLNYYLHVIGVIDPTKIEYDVLRRAVAQVDGTPVFWFQHELAINKTEVLVEQIHYLNSLGAKVYITPHSVHFERTHDKFPKEGTPSGMKKDTYNFLEEILPVVDKVVMLTDGAYQAGIKGFPEYKYKFDEIRHAVHDHPELPSRKKMKEEFFRVALKLPVAYETRDKMQSMRDELAGNRPPFWLGSGGLLNWDKTYYLPQLQMDLENYLGRPVWITYFGGLNQNAENGQDQKALETLQFLEEATAANERFIFMNTHLPDRMFLRALLAPDVAIAYEHANTQSGRLNIILSKPNKHLLPKEAVLPLAQNAEGTGETMRMIGYPTVESKEKLTETTARLLLMPKREPEYVKYLEKQRQRYINKFSWVEQARKHISLIENPFSIGTDIGSVERFREPLEKKVLKEASMRSRLRSMSRSDNPNIRHKHKVF